MTHIKNKIYLIIILIIIIIGIGLFFIRSDEDNWIKDNAGNWTMHGNPAIRDFESCAKKYPVRETYPEQCQIPNGPTFTKQY